MKIYIAHSSDFDYEDKLYRPLIGSSLNDEHEIFLPNKAENRLIKTKDVVREYALLIAEVSKPSTGEGIEIGLAEAYDIPIVCIYEKGAKISNSLQYVTNEFIEYSDTEDMLTKIEAFLSDFLEKN